LLRNVWSIQKRVVVRLTLLSKHQVVGEAGAALSAIRQARDPGFSSSGNSYVPTVHPLFANGEPLLPPQ
jgi:hypothetical protein